MCCSWFHNLLFSPLISLGIKIIHHKNGVIYKAKIPRNTFFYGFVLKPRGEKVLFYIKQLDGISILLCITTAFFNQWIRIPLAYYISKVHIIHKSYTLSQEWSNASNKKKAWRWSADGIICFVLMGGNNALKAILLKVSIYFWISGFR